jgi:hypothetical protein
MLSYDLAETKTHFDKIASFMETEYGNFKPEWKFYNQKSGWILKMFTKKRNVLFIVPCNHFFRVTFTLGDKASFLLFESDLSESIKKELSEAPKHAEGRTIQLEVKTEKDVNNILEITRIKLLN